MKGGFYMSTSYGVSWLKIGEVFYKDEEAKKITDIVHPSAERPYWIIHFENSTVIFTTEPVSYAVME